MGAAGDTSGPRREENRPARGFSGWASGSGAMIADVDTYLARCRDEGVA
jgi:hypothetical protein